MGAYPEFRQSRCTRYRFRYSECRRCVDACPHEAVALSDEGATLDPKRCQNCGLCSSACRTGAWTALNLPRVDLLKQAKDAAAWSFGCGPSGVEADAIVPCLGALDVSMLAYLAKRGVAVELRGTAACERCAHAPQGRAQLEANLEATALLREASDEAWAATAVPAAPADTDDGRGFAAGRRQLFRRLLGGATARTAQTAEGGVQAEPVPDQAIRAGRPFVSEPREILQIVAQSKAPRRIVVREHEALPLLALVAAADCTVCEACFRACPTGALQIHETETTWSLAFQGDHCVACGVCLEVCRSGALQAADQIDATPAQAEAVLFARNRQRCARCDRAFVSPEPSATCPVCADDERAFDAIFG